MQYGADQDYYQIDVPRMPPFYFATEEDENGFDVEKSDAAGYPIPKMIDYIYVNPYQQKGGPSQFYAKDFVERKKKEAEQGLGWHISWVKKLEEAYVNFKAGKAIPETGIPLITYERLPKKRREFLSERFPTLEHLASVPDSALSEIGLDGRVLRDMARNDLKAKQSLSPVVKDLADANETIRRQQELMASLAERLEALESNGKRAYNKKDKPQQGDEA